MPFRLRSSYGPNYPIDRLLYIGRDETCQIRPPDSLVSRVHAAVWVDRGVVQVRDEHASNGTFVNGTRLTSGQTRSLRAGDHARVLNLMIDELLTGHPLAEKELKEVLGHTPREVIGGLLLGVVTAYLMLRVF